MLAAALVWTVGPWTPALACAVDGALALAEGAPELAESMPDCHRPASEPSNEASDRRCCDDVGTSCCLAAPGHVSTIAAAISAVDSDGVSALVAVINVRCPTTALDTVRSRPLDRGGTAPSRTPILRL